MVGDDAMTADLETLRKRWTNLFEEVIQHGRSMGQQEALMNLMTTVQAQLHTLPQPPADPEVATPAVLADAEEPMKRARPGFVQEQVDLVLQEARISLTPMRIVEVARAKGIDLKESSVRMALQGLQTKSRAMPLGNGEWSSITPTLISQAAHSADIESRNAEHDDAYGEAVPEFMK